MTPLRHGLVVLSLSLAVLLSGGCKSDPQGTQCAQNADCSGGLVCGPANTCEYIQFIKQCQTQPKCLDFGYCVAVGGYCQATAETCKASNGCKEEGYCTVNPGGFGCAVGSDGDCQLSNACYRDARCTAKDGRCVN